MNSENNNSANFVDFFSTCDKWTQRFTVLKDFKEKRQAQKARLQDEREKFLKEKANKNFSDLTKAEYMLKKYPSNPRCPRCTSVLVIRTNKTSGQEFWGCSDYPNCKITARIETFQKP